MTYAIILAGGVGHRFGDEIPKQFATIQDKPLLIFPLEKFAACDFIDMIVLVANETYYELTKQIVAKHKFRKSIIVIAGGKNRQDSTWNALKYLRSQIKANNNDIVLIHDACRPNINVEDIENIWCETKKSGAAILVANIKDTIVKINKNIVFGYSDREKLYRVQTPQGFRLSLLYPSHQKHQNESKTDDSQLVYQDGAHPVSVLGSDENIKVTTKADLDYFEFLLSKKSS